MSLLLDTQLLLWSAAGSPRLSAEAGGPIGDPAQVVASSGVSVWEVAIESGLGRGLLDAWYREMAVTSEHAVAIGRLPPLQGDPFDRLLVAQAATAGAILLNADAMVARYPGQVRLVG